METRARRQSLRAAASRSLPQELWMTVLSFMEPHQAARAALVCSEFNNIASVSSWKAMERMWPSQKHRLDERATLGVHRALALLTQAETEQAAHPDVQKATQMQKLVLPEHRQIAVEWLIEVAWDWQLESTVVYRGAQYLDHYLSAYSVGALSKFQMLAISSLRTALKHSSKLAERERARLPYKHWAEVTDGACTEAEVRSTCTKLERLLQQHHRSHPSTKQRLRYLWYRLYDAGYVKQEQVYAYMLASFLLHLSLLDTGLSAITPTLLAAAALSLSLEVFGLEPWPQPLQDHCIYTQQEMQEVQGKLRKVQEELPAKQLRALWVHSYSYIGTNPIQQPAYTHLQLIVSSCCKMRHIDSSGNLMAAGGSGGLDMATATGLPVTAAAVAAVTGPLDGAVVLSLAPGAVAPVAPVGRVTRAAAANLQQRQQQQQQQHHCQQQQQHDHQAAAQRAGATLSAAAASNCSGWAGPSASNQQQAIAAIADALLPTPRRAHMQMPVTAHAAGHGAHGVTGAAALMAGLGMIGTGHDAGCNVVATAAGAAAGQGSNGMAANGRRSTRELPARRAVASSRYGGIASGCRSCPSAVINAQGAGSSAGASSSAASSSLGFAVGNSQAAIPAVAGSNSAPASPRHAGVGLSAGFLAACDGLEGTRYREGFQLLNRLGNSNVLDRRPFLEGTPQPPQLQVLQLPQQQQQQVVRKRDASGRLVITEPTAAPAVDAKGGVSSAMIMLAACSAIAVAPPAQAN